MFCAQKGQIQLSLFFTLSSLPTDLGSWQLGPAAPNSRTFSVWPSFKRGKRLQSTRTGLRWGFRSQIGDKTKKQKGGVTLGNSPPSCQCGLGWGLGSKPSQGPPASSCKLLTYKIGVTWSHGLILEIK